MRVRNYSLSTAVEMVNKVTQDGGGLSPDHTGNPVWRAIYTGGRIDHRLARNHRGKWTLRKSRSIAYASACIARRA
jgi:hypothetical protein